MLIRLISTLISRDFSDTLFMQLFVIVFLFMIQSAFANPCGLTGSVEERMKECNLVKGNFSLVMKTESGLEVYKDTKSGLIWGDRIGYDFNHYGSQKSCGNENPEATLLPLKWRLPTIKEFEQSAANGLKAALPKLTYSFWTSSTASKGYRKTRRRKAMPASVFLWNAVDETTETGSLMDAGSVRCVARE